ncbi:MAG: serine hydrolase domain-containing protein [Gemmatimonadaceae bacterium]
MKQNTVLALAIVLVGIALVDATAQARFTDRDRVARLAHTFPAIDSAFRAHAAAQHMPGAAWGIIIDGRLVHVGVTGVRNLATNAPVEPTSVFRIASMTKSFTAMAILKLRDEGRLALDDPAERYVPELAGLAYPTTDAPRITIRHLLSHATGFPEDNPWGDQQLAISFDSMSALMRQGIPFSNAPGVAYEYSNYGFAILGRIVSRVSGMPYNAYLAQHILRPLGMSSTTMEPRSVPSARLAQGYRWEDEQWKLEPQLADGAFGAMGGMLTSIQDLGAYVGTLLGAWPPSSASDTGPVRRASLREMQRVHNPRSPFAGVDSAGAPRLSAGGYGYGLGISSTCQFEHIVAHTGGLPGFGSIMRWLPEYGVGFIAFGNRTYSGFGGPVDQALRLMEGTGALQPRVPQPSPALESARAAVTRLVQRWNQPLADSVAAVNLFLDQSPDRRAAQIATLRDKVGACRVGAGFDYVENALRGSWLMPCERGNLRATITLAPTVPPAVQFLGVWEPRTTELPRRQLCSR